MRLIVLSRLSACIVLLQADLFLVQWCLWFFYLVSTKSRFLTRRLSKSLQSIFVHHSLAIISFTVESRNFRSILAITSIAPLQRDSCSQLFLLSLLHLNHLLNYIKFWLQFLIKRIFSLFCKTSVWSTSSCKLIDLKKDVLIMFSWVFNCYCYIRRNLLNRINIKNSIAS